MVDREREVYSVVRFSGINSRSIPSLEQELNHIIPGFCDGVDSGVDNRMSCSISDNDDWEAQKSAILETLSQLANLVAVQRSNGVNVSIDVAIDPEDYDGRGILSLQLNASLVKVLAEHGIDFEFSIYGVRGLS